MYFGASTKVIPNFINCILLKHILHCRELDGLVKNLQTSVFISCNLCDAIFILKNVSHKYNLLKVKTLLHLLVVTSNILVFPNYIYIYIQAYVSLNLLKILT